MNLFTLTYIITSLVRPFKPIKCHKIKFAPLLKHHTMKDCWGVAIKPHTYSIPVGKPDAEVRCSGIVHCHIPLDLSSRSVFAAALHLNSCCGRAVAQALLVPSPNRQLNPGRQSSHSTELPEFSDTS